jgi:YD repeat-containing protein
LPPGHARRPRRRPDRISRTVYDELGRVRESWSGVGTADEARDVATVWTDNGAVASVTDANGNSTGYSYDGHDRLARTTYPAAAPHGVTYEELTYESVNGGLHNSPLVASFRNRAGETIHFGYDALGRLASKNVPKVRPYEADVSYGYDNLGALTSTSDGLGHVQIFEHDVHGNLTPSTATGTARCARNTIMAVGERD